MRDGHDLHCLIVDAKEDDVWEPSQHLSPVRSIDSLRCVRERRVENLIERAINHRHELHAETSTLRLVPLRGVGELGLGLRRAVSSRAAETTRDARSNISPLRAGVAA